MGSVVGIKDAPQPFHPIRDRTLNDITVEQHNCTMPVKARPNRECALVAFEICRERPVRITA